MPYLNLDLDYFDHPKTVRLVGLLGRGADLLPVRLWSYCGKFHAENGELTGYSPEEIEAAAKWWGRPGQAVEALEKTGFLERCEQGFKIHDWAATNGHIAAFKERAGKAAKTRWDKIRSLKDAQASTKDAPSNPPTIPNLTNPTLPAPSAKDELWDPLKRIFGLDPRTIADEQRLYQQCTDFRLKGASVPEIERRAAIYRLRFPEMPMTPAAVLRQWEILNEAPTSKPAEPPRKKAVAL